MIDGMDIIKIKNYLENRGLYELVSDKTKMDERKEGREFSFSDHVEGLIFSLLSAQTVWKNIEKNREKIRKIFFEFDADKILEKDMGYFVDKLGLIGCRSRLTGGQMQELPYNISKMRDIASEYGSLDMFVTSQSASDIVQLLSDRESKYKLRKIGPALAWEYLRNVGIDGAKPDVHMKRILGCERLGVSKHSQATDEEVIRTMEKLSGQTGLWMGQIDYIIWMYCATGQGEICMAEPSCDKCVIKDKCNWIQINGNEKDELKNIDMNLNQLQVSPEMKSTIDKKYQEMCEKMIDSGIIFFECMPDHRKNRYRIMNSGSSIFAMKKGYKLYACKEDKTNIERILNLPWMENYKNISKQIVDGVRPYMFQFEDVLLDKIIECLCMNEENITATNSKSVIEK